MSARGHGRCLVEDSGLDLYVGRKQLSNRRRGKSRSAPLAAICAISPSCRHRAQYGGGRPWPVLCAYPQRGNGCGDPADDEDDGLIRVPARFCARLSRVADTATKFPRLSIETAPPTAISIVHGVDTSQSRIVPKTRCDGRHSHDLQTIFIWKSAPLNLASLRRSFPAFKHII